MVSELANTLKFSLYEVFGYLIPGTVAFSGILLLDVLLFHQGYRTSVAWLDTKLGLFVMLGLAYLSGHIVQIIATAALPDPQTAILTWKRYATTQKLYARSKKKLRSTQPGITREEILSACDSCLLAFGPSAEREIYVYREGFYRGNSVSLTICGIACLLTGSFKQYHDLIVTMGSSRSELLTGAVLCFALAAGMYFRALRFANYRLALGLAFQLVREGSGGAERLGAGEAEIEVPTTGKEEQSDDDD